MSIYKAIALAGGLMLCANTASAQMPNNTPVVKVTDDMGPDLNAAYNGLEKLLNGEGDYSVISAKYNKDSDSFNMRIRQRGTPDKDDMEIMVEDNGERCNDGNLGEVSISNGGPSGKSQSSKKSTFTVKSFIKTVSEILGKRKNELKGNPGKPLDERTYRT